MATADRVTTAAIPVTFLPNGRIEVPLEHEDAFIEAAQHAVQFCQDDTGRTPVRAKPVAHFKNHFLRPLHQWCADHADMVDSCYLSYPTDHLRAFVFTTSPRHDFKFGAELAKFSCQLFDAGWSVTLLQVGEPSEEEMSAMFRVEEAFQVYA